MFISTILTYRVYLLHLTYIWRTDGQLISKEFKSGFSGENIDIENMEISQCLKSVYLKCTPLIFMIIELNLYCRKLKFTEKKKKLFLFVCEQRMVIPILPNKTGNSSDICIQRHSNVPMLLNRQPHWVYTDHC